MAYGIIELKLKTTRYQKQVINDIFWDAYQYRIRANKVANHLLKMYFNDSRYKKANRQLKWFYAGHKQNLPKGWKKSDATKVLNELFKDYHLSDFSFYKYMTPIRKKHTPTVKATVAQLISKSISQGIKDIVMGSCKTKRRQNRKLRYPKFRDFTVPQSSIRITEENGTYALNWSKGLQFSIEENNEYDLEVLANRKHKIFRLVTKNWGNKVSYYVQVTYEGLPPLKNRTMGTGKVGVDMGPSQYASVSDIEARFKPLYTDIYREQILSTQRKLDELLIANNQGAMYELVKDPTTGRYTEQRLVIPRGVKLKRSRQYRRLTMKLRELSRRQATTRKQSHEHQANDLIRQGNIIQLETLSYKAWQQGLFGKSIQAYAPGMFIEILKRKIGYFGGEVIELNTYKAKLSQYRHDIEEFHKVGLGDRDKEVGGYSVQRDLYSAFLAQHVGLDTFTVEGVEEDFEDFIRKQGDATVNAREKHGLRFGDNTLTNFGNMGDKYVSQVKL